MHTTEAHRKRTWIPLSLSALLLSVAVLGLYYVYGVVNFTALIRAIEQDNPRSAYLLLRRGTDPHAVGRYGETPLTLAARHNDLALTRESLARGLNPEGVDAWGMTPLMWAALYGSDSVAEALLHVGANVRRRSAEGLTPRMYCEMRGYSATEQTPKGPRLLFRQPAPHPGFARVERLLKQHGAP